MDLCHHIYNRLWPAGITKAPARPWNTLSEYKVKPETATRGVLAADHRGPKVAVLSAVENVTDKMPSTVTAREIAERGVEGCVISGPLALDGAISMESVKHKAIKDPVAGQADILLVPFIEIGNVLYKACSYIAGKTMASTICGASCPVIITSRADMLCGPLRLRYGNNGSHWRPHVS